VCFPWTFFTVLALAALFSAGLPRLWLRLPPADSLSRSLPPSTTPRTTNTTHDPHTVSYSCSDIPTLLLPSPCPSPSPSYPASLQPRRRSRPSFSPSRPSRGPVRQNISSACLKGDLPTSSPIDLRRDGSANCGGYCTWGGLRSQGAHFLGVDSL